MKQEHFPNLDLCKKLTEIWFPKTSISHVQVFPESFHKGDKLLVCPSVMEMLDVMPRSIDEYKRSPMLSLGKDWCRYESYAPDDPVVKNQQNEIYSNTLPNALSEMILWLHENKYITFTHP